MENVGLALKQKKGSLFMIFGTSMMILHNTALRRPFPKLKKHSPTRIYMLYPMAQSVACVCVEIDKKMAPQGGIFHCHHHHHRHPKTKSFWRAGLLLPKLKNIQQSSPRVQSRKNMSAWIVGAANNTPACQQEALPARYRCTASLSTYTDMEDRENTQLSYSFVERKRVTFEGSSFRD
jgi:hypothetical protein